MNIHFGVILLWIVSLLCAWVVIKALNEYEWFGALLAAVAAALFAAWGFHEADPATELKRAERERQKEEAERQDMIPRVVREADGCQVYAFKATGRWHYFTRCPYAGTVTDTAYEHCEGSGKSRRCSEKHTSIETR